MEGWREQAQRMVDRRRRWMVASLQIGGVLAAVTAVFFVGAAVTSKGEFPVPAMIPFVLGILVVATGFAVAQMAAVRRLDPLLSADLRPRPAYLERFWRIEGSGESSASVSYVFIYATEPPDAERMSFLKDTSLDELEKGAYPAELVAADPDWKIPQPVIVVVGGHVIAPRPKTRAMWEFKGDDPDVPPVRAIPDGWSPPVVEARANWRRALFVGIPAIVALVVGVGLASGANPEYAFVAYIFALMAGILSSIWIAEAIIDGSTGPGRGSDAAPDPTA